MKFNENQLKHMNHPFYKEADQYREGVRTEQILKGADKYPNPFSPKDWTSEQLVRHAMQENVDQAHYIYGLYDRIVVLENAINQVLRSKDLPQLYKSVLREALGYDKED